MSFGSHANMCKSTSHRCLCGLPRASVSMTCPFPMSIFMSMSDRRLKAKQ